MTGLTLHLNGAPRLQGPGGAVVVFGPERRYQLLALLALAADWVPRETIAGLLWPGHGTAEARRNLRKVIVRAREVPGTEGLQATDHALRWPVAVQHGSGVLLQGLDDDANPAWTDWLRQQRDLRHQRDRQRLQALDDPAQALALALELLQDDPLDEAAMAATLKAETALGRPAQARRRFAEFSRRLADDLGVAPPDALRALVEPAAATAATASPAPPPAAPDADFVGRRLELAEAQALLAQPGCRLLTVLAPGGMGKSRLARQLLSRVAAGFPGGAHWIELQDLADLPSVWGRLAQQLGLALADGEDALLHVASALPAARTLLVLDNAEHLPGLTASLDRLLDHAPALSLLVTSRARLHGPHEWLLPLAGLAVPDVDSRDAEAAPSFDAVRLFERRARAAQRGFVLDRHLPAVIDICAAVDGMPLAVELAAGWVRLMPPAEIARDLATSLDVLARDPAGPGAPARPEHVDMRSVLARSWQLLGEAEARAMAALSVFRGGFTRAAAQAVAGVPLPLLSALVDRSLLAVEGEGRFNAHPLVQVHAAEQLAADPARAAELRRRHAGHFAGWMAERAPLTRGRMDRLLQEVAGEFANVREAWAWSLQALDAEAIGRIVRAWWVFFEMTGRLAEGAALIAPALALPEDTSERRRALARVRHGLSMLQHRRGLNAEGLEIARAGIAYGEDCGDFEAWTGCVLNSGSCLWVMGALEAAHGAFERALDAARCHGDRHCTAWALGNLGVTLADRGEGERSLAVLREALAIDRELGNQYQVVVHLLNLSSTGKLLGRLEEARARGEEALALALRHDMTAFALTARGMLASLLVRQGRHAEARAQLQQCQQDAQRHGQTQLRIGVLGQLARLRALDGDRAGALHAVRDGVQLAQSCRMAPDVLRCLLGWAQVLRAEGDLPGAARVVLMLQRRPEAAAPDIAGWQGWLDGLGLDDAQRARAEAEVPSLAQVLADLDTAGRAAGPGETQGKRPSA